MTALQKSFLCVFIFAGWQFAPFVESCVVIPRLPREAFNGAQAIYLAKANSDFTFDVKSKWLGPSAAIVDVPFVIQEAAKWCTDQTLPKPGESYIVVAMCTPRGDTEQRVEFICEAAAYPVDVYSDYVEFLNNPCVASREDIIEVLVDWNSGAMGVDAASAIFEHMNHYCDVDDRVQKPDGNLETVSGGVLEILSSVFSELGDCGDRSRSIEEELKAILLGPMVEILEPAHRKPDPGLVKTVIERYEEVLISIYELDCLAELEDLTNRSSGH